MNQRETLKRLLLFIKSERPLPDDLKNWLSTGIERLLTGQDQRWDDALGWNDEPVADRIEQRNTILKRLAGELPGPLHRTAARIARRELPQTLRPLVEEAESYRRIPGEKQLKRIFCNDSTNFGLGRR